MERELSWMVCDGITAEVQRLSSYLYFNSPALSDSFLDANFKDIFQNFRGLRPQRVLSLRNFHKKASFRTIFLGSRSERLCTISPLL